MVAPDPRQGNLAQSVAAQTGINLVANVVWTILGLASLLTLKTVMSAVLLIIGGVGLFMLSARQPQRSRLVFPNWTSLQQPLLIPRRGVRRAILLISCPCLLLGLLLSFVQIYQRNAASEARMEEQARSIAVMREQQEADTEKIEQQNVAMKQQLQAIENLNKQLGTCTEDYHQAKAEIVRTLAPNIDCAIRQWELPRGTRPISSALLRGSGGAVSVIVESLDKGTLAGLSSQIDALDKAGNAPAPWIGVLRGDLHLFSGDVENSAKQYRLAYEGMKAEPELALQLSAVLLELPCGMFDDIEACNRNATEAIDVCRDALSRLPMDARLRARAHLRVSIALRKKKQDTDSARLAGLTEAIDELRIGLSNAVSAGDKLFAAELQLDLADSLATRASDDPAHPDLVEARRLYQEAGAVITETTDPRTWAFILAGHAQLLLAEAVPTNDRQRYSESVRLFRQARDTLAINGTRTEIAFSEYKLGEAILLDPSGSHQPEALREAVFCVQHSLELTSPQKQPEHWADANQLLGMALMPFEPPDPKTTARQGRLVESAYRFALDIRRVLLQDDRLANLQMNLARCLIAWNDSKTLAERSEEIIALANAALKYFSEKGVAEGKGISHWWLAMALRDRDAHTRCDNLKEAVRHARSAEQLIPDPRVKPDLEKLLGQLRVGFRENSCGSNDDFDAITGEGKP